SATASLSPSRPPSRARDYLAQDNEPHREPAWWRGLKYLCRNLRALTTARHIRASPHRPRFLRRSRPHQSLQCPRAPCDYECGITFRRDSSALLVPVARALDSLSPVVLQSLHLLLVCLRCEDSV